MQLAPQLKVLRFHQQASLVLALATLSFLHALTQWTVLTSKIGRPGRLA